MDDSIAVTHRPQDLVDEMTDGVEGLPLSSDEMAKRVGDPDAWAVGVDAARAIERVLNYLG